jgi:predicted XRE-type DNA-binding protein
MIYLLWKTDRFSIDQIGSLFGVSDSAVSHVVRSLKSKLQDNLALLTTLNEINLQFTL